MIVLILVLGGCAGGRLSGTPSPAAGEERGSDFETALRLAESGDADAQYRVGMAYLNGHDIGLDRVEGVRWLQLAADQGHTEAQNDLGGAYFHGIGVPGDDHEAMRWFRRAADQGHAGAIMNVGIMHRNGRGVPRDPAEAVRWFSRSAELGHAPSQVLLGSAYAEGEGVPADEVAASRWIRLAAERLAKEHGSHPDARRLLGGLLFEGRGVPRDEGKALDWLHQAAAQQDAIAAFMIGAAYREGRGVPANPGEAAFWFRLAADRGHAMAQNNLGVQYHTGNGVPVDFDEAARWIGKAAAQGVAIAQDNLGNYYLRGIGVKQDPLRAYLWLHRATAQGYEPARTALDALTKRMTPAQLEDARRLATDVEPERPPVVPETSAASVTVAPTRVSGLRDPLIPRDALFLPDGPRSPFLSPDGRRLAYLARWNGVLNIWVRTLGKNDDRPVTRETTWDITKFGWACDGKQIIFARTSDGDHERPHRVDIGTGAICDLTPPQVKSMAPVTAGLGCFPSDNALFMAGNGHVYRIDLKDGTFTVDAHNPGNVSEWLADRHGQVRGALARTQNGETLVRVREDRKAPWRVIQRWRSEDDSPAGHLISFTADGRALLLLSSVDAPTLRVVRVDVATGATRVIAEHPEFDVSGVLSHHATSEVQAVAAGFDGIVIDRALGRDFELLGRLGDGQLHVASRDRNDRTWIVALERSDYPPAYFLYDRRTRSATPLFQSDSSLAGHPLATMKSIEFRARDGRRLHGYLTLPGDGERKQGPMVLLVHGGPWERDVPGFNAEVQWLANRGYAVLQVNFRGSTGYGKAHLNAGNREWGGKMLDDLLDARTWAISEHYTAPGRICIMGHSYGGYAVLIALALQPDAFACGVSGGAVTDLPAQVRSLGIGPARTWWDRRVGSLDGDAALLRDRSPLHRRSTIKAPLLMVHGADDSTVSRLQSDVLVSALRTDGKPVAYLVLPGEGHRFPRRHHVLRYLAVVEHFLANVLGGTTQPPEPGEEWEPLLR